MHRRSIVFAFATGALLAGFLASSGRTYLGDARAEDLPGMSGPIDPVDPTSPGRTINPSTGSLARGTAVTHTTSEGANGRAIAIAAQAGTENVIYYFDTEQDRILVYQYLPGDRGGLKLRAARHIVYDLRLDEYRDLSDRSRDELKAAFDAAFARPAGRRDGSDELPVKKVDASPGK